MNKMFLVEGIELHVHRLEDSSGYDESILHFIFMFLLFCLPHKKVTKKVTTANTMLCNAGTFILDPQEAWCTHPWTATHRCLLQMKHRKELNHNLLFRLWQNLALCVEFRTIKRNEINRFFRRMVTLTIENNNMIATNNVFDILTRVALRLPWAINFKAYSLRNWPEGPLSNSQVRSAWFEQGNKILWQSGNKIERIQMYATQYC